jgi:hypothetical protein
VPAAERFGDDLSAMVANLVSAVVGVGASSVREDNPACRALTGRGLQKRLVDGLLVVSQRFFQPYLVFDRPGLDQVDKHAVAAVLDPSGVTPLALRENQRKSRIRLTGGR